MVEILEFSFMVYIKLKKKFNDLFKSYNQGKSLDFLEFIISHSQNKLKNGRKIIVQI